MAAAFAEYSRHTVGLLLLLGVVFIWVGSSFLVSNLFGEQQYNRPFFITYLNTSTFSFYLVGVYISHLIAKPNTQAARKRSRSDDSLGIQSTSIDSTPTNASGTQYHRDENIRNRSEEASLVQVSNEQARSNNEAVEKLTVRETVRLGVAFSMLWFAANVTQNASLAYTSVASSSILCSTSGLFTLVIGYVAHVETFNAARLTAVLASILGVYCIIKYGSQETNMVSPHSWIGDFLALLSAALYGCYTILLKRQIGDESRLNTPLFFGVVGLANTLLLWPGIVILHVSGIETFQLPHSQSMWAMILVNAFIGTFLSDYLWLLAMLMTSPLVVTLGLSLTIPLSMAGDIVFKGLSVSFPYYVGALLVLGAFIGVNF
ncbi:hypothetical protein LPJ79_002422 [Coemansia sp. RSA 1821]|nr:hypothetical protein BX667DRAFT_497259 [Coemansia mojavensis]KAJ1741462.1 hypothetical protein LPJ68_002810 [Coemansia sp. RSA 1086]KAJ1751012.1 hypothetical protein LPJ79_002422 [Coemansia sp. RSA 1821]